MTTDSQSRTWRKQYSGLLEAVAISGGRAEFESQEPIDFQPVISFFCFYGKNSREAAKSASAENPTRGNFWEIYFSRNFPNSSPPPPHLCTFEIKKSILQCYFKERERALARAHRQGIILALCFEESRLILKIDSRAYEALSHSCLVSILQLVILIKYKHLSSGGAA